MRRAKAYGFFSAATAAAIVSAAATAVVVIAVVAAAAEEKDKDDDPPAAVIVVSEHEISPRKKNYYIGDGFFRFAGMLYDMKTPLHWLQSKNLRNDRRIL